MALRTRDGAQGTILDFFLDGKRDSGHAPAQASFFRHYVHGPILDEAIAHDMPLPQGGQVFSGRCDFDRLDAFAFTPVAWLENGVLLQGLRI